MSTITSTRSRYRGPYSRAGNRLRNLERVIGDRHGKVPDTDDDDIYLVPVAQCFRKIMIDRGKLASVDEVTHRFLFWCEDGWAPHVTAERAADIVRRVLAQPRKLEQDDYLGKMLRLSHSDRDRLRIRTIGSYDIDRKTRKKLQRIAKRERDRIGAERRRRAEGAAPRAEYEAGSLSKIKPWVELGMSRRTWERRRKKGLVPSETHIDASASLHPSYIHGRRTCVTTSLTGRLKPWEELGISRSTYYRRRDNH
jgi:hypothetical protein